MTGIERAIAQAGGVRHLARKLGISGSAVSQWKSAGVVPADDGRALEVERITGVHRHFLNPTVYPEVPPAKTA